MATSKTLTPTNVTIQIPEFTDQPDQRVNSNCIDKEADAINALNTAIANLPKIQTVSYTTTADIQVPANGMKEIGTASTVLGDSAAFVLSGLIIANGYEKIIIGMNRYGSTVYVVARNIDGTAKTIASGTTITLVKYKA